MPNQYNEKLRKEIQNQATILLKEHGFKFIEYNQIKKNKYMVIICPKGHVTDKKTFAGFKKNPCCSKCTQLEKDNRYSHINFEEEYKKYNKNLYSLRNLAKELDIPYSRLREEFKNRELNIRTSKEVFNTKLNYYTPQRIYLKDEVLWSTIPFAPDYKINEFGVIKGKRTEYLNQYFDKDGYMFTALQTRKNKRITVKVHRIMGICFIPNFDNKPQINHKNGIKNDNRIENLEWCTEEENVNHSFDNHLQKAILGNNNKLSYQQVFEIYQNKDNFSASHFARKYDVNLGTIKFLLNKGTWRWITDKLDVLPKSISWEEFYLILYKEKNNEKTKNNL